MESNDKLITLGNLRSYTGKLIGGFGKSVSIQNCSLSRSGTTSLYYGTLEYTDNAGAQKSSTISFDASEFIGGEGGLSSIGYSAEPGKENFLVFTWSDSSKQATEIDLSKYLNIYSGDETTIHVENGEISAKTINLNLAPNKKTVSASDTTSLATASQIATAINEVVAANKNKFALTSNAEQVMTLSETTANDGSGIQTLDAAFASDEEVIGMLNGLLQ